MEKSDIKLELLTLTQLYGLTLVSSPMGNRTGHSGNIAICPVACTLDSHCAIVQIFFLSDTISFWGPGDLCSWLPRNCLAHHSFILALKQGHLRGHCKDVGKNTSVLTHEIRNLETFISVSNLLIGNTTIYDASYLTLGGDSPDGNSHQLLPSDTRNTHHERWLRDQSEG